MISHKRWGWKNGSSWSWVFHYSYLLSFNSSKLWNIIQKHDFLASSPGSEMAPSLIQIHAFRKGNCCVRCWHVPGRLFPVLEIFVLSQSCDGSIHPLQGELASSVGTLSKCFSGSKAHAVRVTSYLNVQLLVIFPIN